MDKRSFDITTVKILTRAANTICITVILFCFLVILMPRSSIGFEDLIMHRSVFQSFWIIIPMVITALVVLVTLFALYRNYKIRKISKAQQDKHILNMPLEQYGADTAAKTEIPVQNYQNVSEGFMDNGANIAAAQEAHIKRMLDANAAETAKYAGLARQAVQAGKEDDARVFIEMKQNLEAARKALDTAYNNVMNMRRTQDSLMRGMQNIHSSSMVNVSTTVTKNGKIVNQTSYTNMPQNNPDVFVSINDEAGRLLAKANAMFAAMGTEPMDPSLFMQVDVLGNEPSVAGFDTRLKDEAEALAEKYAARGAAAPAGAENNIAERKASVDEELSKIKSDMGM